jgi:hypothetical protein
MISSPPDTPAGPRSPLGAGAAPSEVADIAAQVLHARDIWHLRETARMLLEDRPDKIRAIKAINDIADKRWALMGPDARRLLEIHPAPPGCDWGDWLEGLLAIGSDPDDATTFQD